MSTAIRRSLRSLAAAAAVACALAGAPKPAAAGLDPFLGEIAMVGFNFAPRGWAMCQGQILSIAQNTALFALLGTMYGGNGVSTFALPNLGGRVAIGSGQSQGTSNYVIGQAGGAEERGHPIISADSTPGASRVRLLP